jgi:nucleotide-binding universal stress UspA family protein
VRGGGSGAQSAEEYLRTVADRLKSAGMELEVHVYSDDATSAIVNAAQLRGGSGKTDIQALPHRLTELIFIASHERTGLAAMLHKSVSESVLAHAEMPVMIVPPQAVAWQTDKPVSLLVAVDGSSLSEVALATAARMAEALNGQLVALEVVESAGDDAWTAAKEYLEAAADRYAKPDISLEQVIMRGEPARVIAEVAGEKHADVVVLATHGRTGEAGVTMGRTAKALLHAATFPVVLVRPTTLQFEQSHGLASVSA